MKLFTFKRGDEILFKDNSLNMNTMYAYIYICYINRKDKIKNLIPLIEKNNENITMNTIMSCLGCNNNIDIIVEDC